MGSILAVYDVKDVRQNDLQVSNIQKLKDSFD